MMKFSKTSPPRFSAFYAASLAATLSKKKDFWKEKMKNDLFPLFLIIS